MGHSLYRFLAALSKRRHRRLNEAQNCLFNPCAASYAEVVMINIGAASEKIPEVSLSISTGEMPSKLAINESPRA